MKIRYVIFLAVCLLLCLLPSVCTLFMPTTETTENKAMAAAPALRNEDGSWNKEAFSDFEDWFEEHMAFRNMLVSADARIMSGIFETSNISGVVTGTDGWLYYSNTLKDYLGTAPLSDRELYNIAHNLSVVQSYLDERGVESLLLLPVNKNTLYGENMPYYDSLIVEEPHNLERLEPLLAEAGVNYLSLRELFLAQDEILYLMRDSHWNNRGALLACTSALSRLSASDERISNLTETAVENSSGDLNKMLYSFYGTSEQDYSYNLPGSWSITNGASGVEDGWIVTENAEGQGTLLMFRDSFGNTMLPFFSEVFEDAYYSKSQPHHLERYLEQSGAGTVILEKVERNLGDYLKAPPILTAPTAEEPLSFSVTAADCALSVETFTDDPSYCRITGTVPQELCGAETEFIVAVNGEFYRAYQTADNGLLLYLKHDSLAGESVLVRVFLTEGDSAVMAASEFLDLP